MDIQVTETARERLETLAGNEEKTVRINGELVGGCGMTVEYFLWWDEILPGDLKVSHDRLTFVVDKETREYIGTDTLKIDFHPQQGFRLITPQQILAYGLAIKDRWA
ncbi:iron-sulfur cluster biosynthesis family protein [Brevibacillus sp. TJ4]|uniref:iron-sulfur cluster biosynthesis family protein n=1 Tax=Brevibacillus sp. TJ4 TaxID=3234853 RepID=UPI0037D47AC7